MKKDIIKNIKLIVFGGILAIGVSYVFADTWVSMPSSFSSTNNIASPINVGNTDQVKTGDLSVYGFVANQAASFKGSVFFPGIIRGGNATDNGNIAFGDTTHTVNASVSGTLKTGTLATTGGSVTVTSLANDDLRLVCADTTGTLVFCKAPPATDLCTNISGTQSTIPTGYWRNEDGTCDKPVDVCANIPGMQPTVPTDSVTGQAYNVSNGNCYDPISVSTTVNMGTGCTADFPDHGGFFDTLYYYTVGQLPLWDVDQHGKENSPGTYGIKLTFSRPLPEPIKISFKVCTSQPTSVENWLGTSTYFDSYVTCEQNSKEFAGRKDENAPALTAAQYTSWLNDPSTKPYEFTLQPGATSLMIPGLFCSRSGTSADLKWARVSPDAISIVSTDLDPTNAYNTVISPIKRSDFLCTSSDGTNCK